MSININNMIYTIYHIPGVKIGCTNNPTGRVHHRQGYRDFEILEEHEDIYVASDREIELQKQYGYRVDRCPYWKTYEGAQRPNIKTHQRLITMDQANEIREKYIPRVYSQDRLAEEYGISRGAIAGILKNKTYRNDY